MPTTIIQTFDVDMSKGPDMAVAESVAKEIITERKGVQADHFAIQEFIWTQMREAEARGLKELRAEARWTWTERGVALSEIRNPDSPGPHNALSLGAGIGESPTIPRVP